LCEFQVRFQPVLGVTPKTRTETHGLIKIKTNSVTFLEHIKVTWHYCVQLRDWTEIPNKKTKKYMFF